MQQEKQANTMYKSSSGQPNNGTPASFLMSYGHNTIRNEHKHQQPHGASSKVIGHSDDK